MFLKRKGIWFLLLAPVILFFFLLFFIKNDDVLNPSNIIISNGKISKPTPTEIPIPAPSASYIIPQKLHVYQSFNNCGPASLSMALSYYGIKKTQDELGNDLRPYQISSGDNDDKSVTLEELSEKSKEYGLIPYHRPMGNINLLKFFISNNIPVITRTWTKPTEDIGHYRIVRGYDDTTKIIIQDDSLQGKNLNYNYEDFDVLWEKFNFEFLVLIPQEKKEIAEKILGDNVDQKTAWRNAVKFSEEKLTNNPNDIFSRFNLSVALYNSGNYQRSVEEFEKVENLLPFRTLWYQIEPIEAYYALGNYNRVFEITDKILNYHNRAFSELYILRGKSYQKLGNLEAARSEFEKAVLYNTNLKKAQELLSSLPI